ncbi:juvenile hormone acid O-methyltransferase-like [Cydia pomonella]|uniref:juvenile hormone acid O-methyltransferase-like n=1 Tax=Cydia pomonella TaxID=82600 RepID=UPI002ADE7FE0|nr:juvenile hormone acid O-methyltransferase-like [Cydia pomonella]
MRDLKMYQQMHAMPAGDVKATLEEFSFPWNNNATILDIGCGDGSITVDIWQSYAPKDFKMIIGSDKSQLCVDFATEHYKSERVQFLRLDIEEEVQKELVGSSDHVVSSYTFHWVNLQETAFSNVYKLLAEGGSCLLIFLGYFKPYENYRTLSRLEKWSADLKDVKTKFMSPYHDSQDPQNEIIEVMQRVGFKNIRVKLHHKTFDYASVQDFKNMMKCLNPFEGLKDKWNDFMDDYVKLDPKAGNISYQLLVVSGTK